MKLPRPDVDRWDMIMATGAGLLGGGIWGLAGPAWACVTWGVLLLALANLHAVMAARAAAREGRR